MEPAVGASPWASGSQVWKGQIGTLMQKATKKPTNASALTVLTSMPSSASPWRKSGQVSTRVAMLKVPADQPISCVASSMPSVPPKE